MIDIDMSRIDRKIYLRGMAYYNEGRVKEVYVDEDEDGYSIDAVVEGTEDYGVQIEIVGEDIVCTCDCPAYFEYGGICKHIVATLLYIKHNPQIFDGNYDEKDHTVEEGLIKEFVNSGGVHQDKVPVNIELSLEQLDDVKERPAFGLAMRVGSGRLYVVKSMRNFAKAIYNREELKFGKDFTYSPDKCCFKDEDQPIIDYLLEMYDIDRKYYTWGDTQGGIFLHGKYLYIPESSKKRFFDIMGDKKFKLLLNNREYDDVQIVREDVPVLYDVKADGDNIELSVSGGILNSYPLDRELNYVFRNNKVFSIPSEQRKYLIPILSAVGRKRGKSLTFSGEHKQQFIDKILPTLSQSGEVVMDEKLKNQIRKEPLKAKAYLDRDDVSITLRMEYVYGEYFFNAFKQTDMKGIIIVRDLDAEKRITDVLADYHFVLNDGTLRLDDDEDIYNFLDEGVDRLNELCEVYCTDAFKNMMMYNSKNYSISVRLNQISNVLKFSFNVDGIDDIDISELAKSIREKKRYHRLKNGSYLSLDAKGMDTIADIAESSGLKNDDLRDKTIEIPAYRVMYVDQKLSESDIKTNADGTYRDMVGRLKKPENLDFALPDSLAGVLRPYQERGFKWLKTLTAYDLGGILADDMGLGKTLQGLALLLSEKEEHNLYGRPAVVVCPTSLVYNWESEAKRFTPSLNVMVISGNRSERERMIADADGYDLVVTSYPLIRRDIELYKDREFSFCILDEAQHIKNPLSDSARSVKEIKSRRRFAFTGTPIENNLTELWSIFDFLMPGYLFSHKKFVEKFEKPIIKDNDKKALDDLIKHIRPFVLRRMKKDVLKELPDKIETCYKAELTKQQKMVYMSYLHRIKDEIGKEIDRNGFEKSKIKVLAGLTRLRQICCHPGMFLEGYSGGSGKLDLLMETVEDIKDGGKRALLFSQFTSALNIISKELDKRGITYFYLDGSVKSGDRFDMVKRFNEGERDIFLISLKAGGTGLNLTGADTVIHFDPWWNPAVEDQATDRAHRIGQKNVVQVIKLISQGTIEEKIIDLQNKKRDMVNSVIDSEETFISSLTEDDIKELFAV
ncbi:MAG: SNF2 helicase associated domain-containing protein [Thermoanaerobacteraceae bacterium]|nr:SNF2 helicase associated domain-containing protein [Thermoanaerobacteraceae bacterium]